MEFTGKQSRVTSKSCKKFYPTIHVSLVFVFVSFELFGRFTLFAMII